MGSETKNAVKWIILTWRQCEFVKTIHNSSRQTLSKCINIFNILSARIGRREGAQENKVSLLFFFFFRALILFY